MKLFVIIALCLFSTMSFASPFIEVSNVPKPVLNMAQNHMNQVSTSALAPEWQDATIRSATKFHRSNLNDVAYYEFAIYKNDQPKGFMIVSAGAHDFKIPHWKTSGPSPAAVLTEKFGSEYIERFLKEDVFAYGAQLTTGEIVGIDASLTLTESSVRQDYERELAQQAAQQWATTEGQTTQGQSTIGADLIRLDTPLPSPQYGQFKSGVGPNTSDCLSGCGATAWGILFAWADIQAETSPKWMHTKGIYRENGGKYTHTVAPEKMDVGVRNMMWEIRNHVGTWCYSGEGATGPWNMLYAKRYLKGRTSATIDARYNMFGKFERRIKDFAIASIRVEQTPVIIGTGWLKHYPVAISYAYKRGSRNKITEEWFYLNQGWSGSGNEWIAAGTWFAGNLKPAR